MIEQRFPKGWDLDKVKEVIDYYDNQSEDEAVEEMERGFEEEDRKNGIQWMPVPIPLVDEVTKLIAKRQSA